MLKNKKNKMKNQIRISTLILLTLISCKSQNVVQKPNSRGASVLDLDIAGFVSVNPNKPGNPFPSLAYQVELTDTVGSSKNFTLKNHIALLFESEIETIKAMKKIIPVASVDSRYDETKKYFLVDGNTRPVIWAYGKQTPIPQRYLKYMAEKGKTDNRSMAYANYSRHIIWPVSISAGDQTLNSFQILLQQKEASGIITNKFVFVVGMEYSQIKSLISNNTKGIVFEISDVAFDKKTGEWKKESEVNDKNKVIYTFAWNAEEGKTIVNPFK